MTIIRDLKQTVKNGIDDATKLTELMAEEVGQELKHEIRKEAIDQKVDDLKEGYRHMKQTIKNEFR